MGDEAWAPGVRFHDLGIERELGRGAFGRVYLARDAVIDRRVALKVVPRLGDEDRGRERVLREARAVGRLSHPNIVTLYRFYPPAEQDAWVFEFEYVEGGSLRDLLGADRVLQPDRATEIARGVGSGLSAAHAAGVVHGDVKPGNVLLTTSGSVKLGDFGLARLRGDLSQSFSSTSAIVGTPVFMAPEIVMGERPTSASDVWAFGVLLYRMLAGRMPFVGDSVPVLFCAIQQAEPAPLGPLVPSHVQDLVNACLAKEPDSRPSRWDEILAQLDPAQPAPGARRSVVISPGILGRDAERTVLERILTQAERGEGAAARILGPTGIGKTALVHEMRTTAVGRGFRWLEASVTSLRGMLRPLLEAARGAVDVGDAHDSLFGSAATIVHRLLDEEMTLRLESRSQTVWALEQLLRGIARDRKLALVVEDAHLADAEDRRTLAHLARSLPGAGIILVVTERTDGREEPDGELASSAGIVEVRLGPLSRADTHRMIERWAGTPRIPAEVAQHILSASEGNPLFVGELLRHLEQTGALLRGDSVRIGPAWSAATPPLRIRDLVAARAASFDEGDRELLDVAAVDGSDFDGEAVAAVTERPLLLVLRQLQRLYREHGMIVPSDQGFRFANTLFHDVLYADLAPELRRAFHLALAEHLESRAQPPDPERIGTHWERAQRPDRAAPHLERAAWRASQRQEYLRAVELGRRAGLLRNDLDPAAAVARAEVLLALAGCLVDLGKRKEAEGILDVLSGAAVAKGDEELGLRTAVWRSDIRYLSAGAEAADQAALVRAADILPEGPDRGRALYLLGLMAKTRGDLAGAETRLAAADAIFARTGHASLHSSTLDQLAQVAAARGHGREAEQLYEEAARVSRACGRQASAAVSDGNRALIAFERGPDPRLERVLEDAIHVLDLAGLHALAAHFGVSLAAFLYDRGAREEAERRIDDALAALEGTEYPLGLAAALHEKAHLAFVRGDLAGAAQAVERGRAAAQKAGSGRPQAAAAALEAVVHAWGGEAVAAAEAVQAAVALEGGGSSPFWMLLVAEAALYGLPGSALDLLPAASARPTLAGRVLAGARAFADPAGPADALLDAAAAFRDPATGGRRAALAAVASCFESEALRRGGSEAAAPARAALAAARALGHVWLEAAALRLLARVEPSAGHAGALDALLGRVTPGNDALTRAWVVSEGG
ncbi:MAG TPA: protein kinase [Planctomycetota bacterium]|nr:protein kinase [Planctomycetota bacterium]